MATRPRQFRRKDIKPGRLLANPSLWDGEQMAADARYAGHGKHKTYPPPDGSDQWRPIWTDDGSTERCEIYEADTWSNLQRLLKEAITGGFIGAKRDGTPYVAADGFPKRAWARIGDTLHEARYSQNREYHAFPLTRRDCWPQDPGGRLSEAPRWDP